MSSNVLILLEMVFVLGGAITLVVWQLIALKGEHRRHGQCDAARPDAGISSVEPRQPER